MPYCNVAKLVTETKTNTIDEMASGYGTIRTTAVRIRHQLSCRAAQRSQLLQNWTILQVNSCSILNAPPSLQMLLEASENALAAFESTLLSSRGPGSISKYLEGLVRSTGVSWMFTFGFWTDLHYADGVCCTWCMLFFVYAVLSVYCTQCMLYFVYDVLGDCCIRCMLSLVYAVFGACCTQCILYLVYAVFGACCTRLMLYSVYGVLGACCTRCMPYSVYAVLGVCCARCMLYSVYAVLSLCCTTCMLYSVNAVHGVCFTQCMLYSVYVVLGVCCTRCQLILME